MAVVLFDTAARARFYPFSYTKAIAHFRFGLFTIQERWQQLLNDEVYIETEPYLQCLYHHVPEDIHTWINTCVLPMPGIIEKIKSLHQGEFLEDENGIVAGKGLGKSLHDALENSAMNFTQTDDAKWLSYPHQILQWNDYFIKQDFEWIRQNRTSQLLSKTNQCLSEDNIIIEEGASVEFSIINASTGPIYIGKNATVMEGSMLRGPISIGENSVVKMGSKIYGATSIGPNCVAGGEIKNVVMMANSNKAHDGYLGDSIIGEWCNFGAGTSNSNLKNTAGDIVLWNEFDKAYVNAGNKCGVMMGDYTRMAINSCINTGSVYGICCNVFGESLLPKRLRNFSWGVGGEGYMLENAIMHIRQWKNFKHQTLSKEEESVLKYIFENLLSE